MSTSENDFDAEQQSKKWRSRLEDEYEKMAALMPVHFGLVGTEFPGWLENVERELRLVLFPAAKLRDKACVKTPKRMGAVIGHSCAMAVWLMEWFKSKNAAMEGGSPTLPNQDEVRKAESLSQAFERWYHAARRLAKLALCSCVDQPYEDMRDFLLGYADGFSRKPKTFVASDMGNTTFEVYLFLLIYWRNVDQMKSVRELHETLIKIFGANRVGDQKRVEKICQRIGLYFRKPGRPKKE